MREISVNLIRDAVARLCIAANTHLPTDVKCAIETCRACEDGALACSVLDDIIENYNLADADTVITNHTAFGNCHIAFDLTACKGLDKLKLHLFGKGKNVIDRKLTSVCDGSCFLKVLGHK